LIYLPFSVPIPYSFYCYCSVVHLEVRDADPRKISFIFENGFRYPRFFVILMNLRNALYNSMKNWVGSICKS
jgi:hypothetical protein